MVDQGHLRTNPEALRADAGRRATKAWTRKYLSITKISVFLP